MGISSVKHIVLLAILNVFESDNGCEVTSSAEEMHAQGVRDIDSLESYLRTKFNFHHFSEKSLRSLFSTLMIHFPCDDLLPPPVDAEIDYDDENTMSIGLSVYVNVFNYRKASLTFRKYSVKLPQLRTLTQVVDVLQSVSAEAFKISGLLAAGSEFKTYWLMNSWNGLTGYSRCIEIHRLPLTSEELDRGLGNHM